MRDIGKQAGAETIVHAVVEMARKLGFRTVAEGVETEEQVAMLRDIGVDDLQGYYFSKPVSGEQFVVLARQERILPGCLSRKRPTIRSRSGRGTASGGRETSSP